MQTTRRRFLGIIAIEESLYRKNICFLGVRVWQTRYLAQTLEHRLFGVFHVSTTDYYPCGISVVMPARNAEKHIAGAIDAILAQTFTDFEFIIINDASSDNTESIIRGYADKRIRLVNVKCAIGSERALSLGLDLCRGEYVAIMPADAVADADCLEKEMTATGRRAGRQNDYAPGTDGYMPERPLVCRLRKSFEKKYE